MKIFHHETQPAETIEPATPEPPEAATPPAATAPVAPPDDASPAARWPTLSQWFDTAFSACDPIHIEEVRDGDVLVIRAELPGIDPAKDVEVTVSHGMLRIHGERTEETTSDEDDDHRSEYRYGAFTRVLPLPAGATEADVKASYADGFLEVRVPVDAGVAASKAVPVTVA